jgi:hypothetical protein
MDGDVLLAVEERARRERRAAGEVISELARHALMAGPADAEGGSFHGVHPFPRRGEAVSNHLIEQLREDDAV